MAVLGAEGVLITAVYGSRKSSVAAEIACLLEQRRQPYALLDLDFLGRGVNYRDALRGIREAVAVPLRVARLSLPTARSRSWRSRS
jgi:hypothetical protein